MLSHFDTLRLNGLIPRKPTTATTIGYIIINDNAEIRIHEEFKFEMHDYQRQQQQMQI